MGEHHCENAIIGEDPESLLKRRCHLALVVAGSELLLFSAQAREAGRIGHRFVVLVGQVVSEQIRVDGTESALQPYVEEVRQLAIHDVVVVRRVSEHKIDATVLQVVQIGCRGQGEFDGDRVLAPLEDVVGRSGQLPNPLVGVGDLLQGPGEEVAGGVELTVGPLEGVVVAIEDTPDLATCSIPAREVGVVVDRLAEHHAKVGDDRLRPIRGQFLLDFGDQFVEGLDVTAQRE